MKLPIQLLAFIFSFLGLLSCAVKAKEEIKKPNVIIILADDLGYGDIGAFNPDSKIPTPYIDQMAKQGMIFTDAHTPSAVCTPTRYGLLTGRYNWRSTLKSGVLTGNSTALIPKGRSTIASTLKNQGYHTAFIGKWHLGWNWATIDGNPLTADGWGPNNFDQINFNKPVTHTPNDLGFEYAYGHAGSLDMAPYVYVENGKVTAMPDKVTVDKGKYSWWREGPTSPDFDHEKVTPHFFEKSIAYIQEQAKEEKPFFLYLALPSPHTPILPPAEWQGKSGLAPFGDFMMMIDDYVGQLNAAIKAAGIEENTLIIFTSDNGGSPAAGLDVMQEAGHFSSYIYRGHKADIFEGGHRVPFIAKWPAKIQKGTSRSETICLTDLMATGAELSGYELKDNEGEDSYSLMSLFDANNKMAQFREATVSHSINGSFAIRQGDWKLIMAKGSGGWSFPKPNDPAEADLPEVQLYNLATDPGEMNNVYAENGDKVASLKALLSKYIKEGRSTPGAPQFNDKIEGEWKQIGFLED
ncbi:arylsulfatase A-like enzyme [Algoriphagus ratkowskyi]|uniref:Arylsulfatase n=1 Tax=Algoriphagus ratkowskyi TaxID=57028 RepID=A0A2W7RMH5_9BACT|nr:arylsulfatase [Algoriphagus ratkowskyi]PZX59690.1 arylsulfatase A-like enzyme [Algoriphagus ratkowskyi]TXD78593.1 arylsulfatase [Algoriphagus ratkowskyi]